MKARYVCPENGVRTACWTCALDHPHRVEELVTEGQKRVPRCERHKVALVPADA